MDNKILILGAEGFIGRNLLDYFYNQNLSITATFHSKKPYTGKGNFYPCDLLIKKEIEEIIDKVQPEIVINCAFIGVSSRIPYSRDYIINNIRLISNIVESLKNAKNLLKFINIGSGLEYNDSMNQISESYPIAPKNIYAATKVACTYIADSLSHYYNIPLLILRPFHLYGPYDNKSVIYYLISSCLTNKNITITKGEQIFDYLYIEDFCDLIYQIIKNQNRFKNYDLYNIGRGVEVQLASFFSLIMKKLEYKNTVLIKNYSDNEYMYHVADISKITKILKWEPKYSLEKGLLKTIEWVKSTL